MPISDSGLNADWFSKPGDSLRELMKRRATDAEYLAGRLEGGMSALRGLLDGTLAIDADRATALADTIGGTREFWLKRQSNYEASLNRAVDAAAAAAEAEEWIDRVPRPGPRRRGRLSDVALKDELRQRMAYFNVPSIASWHERYGRVCANTRFRTSNSYCSLETAVLLWLRRGELETDLVPTRAWKSGNLQDRLSAIRKLSRISQPSRFFPKLRTLCAEAGVAVVAVRAPQGCRASGATRLVMSNKAMMLLSFRHRADDQFWFTVFHEMGHLILHGAHTFVDGDGTPEDEREREANQFASQCIIPADRFAEFADLSADRDSVIRFSVSIGVSPGLTVGQMQHRRMIPFNRLNSLKRHWTWGDIGPVLI